MARVGTILGGSALLIYGLKRRSLGGALLSVVGGGLVYRGATGRLPLVPERGIRVERAVTVNRPREEVYRFWRDVRNLPRFMRHLVSVTAIDERRSHWVARAPAGRTVEWDAELIEDRAPERLAWRSLPGGDVDHAGAVTFTDAPAGRGVEVRVVLEVTPPAGTLGNVIARLFGESPVQQVTEDLRRFKQVLEAGEVPTTDGQPAGWSYLRTA
jgi:uncharacterized membrane protein